MKRRNFQVCVFVPTVLAAATLTALAPNEAAGIVIQGFSSTIPSNPFIFNPDLERVHQDLADNSTYNPVGRLNMRIPSDEGFTSTSCTGSLIGRKWVLTAAHCVDSADQVTFNLAGESVNGQRWFMPGQYDGISGALEGYDIALVKLERGIGKARPARMMSTGSEINKDATVVVYGAWGTGFTGGLFPGGIKRAGTNKIEGFLPGAGRRAHWWDFDIDPADPSVNQLALEFDRAQLIVSMLDPASATSGFDPLDFLGSDPGDYPNTLEVNTAPGDSGGPIFSAGRIAAVVSGGFNVGEGTGEGYFDISFNTRVQPWIKWIRNVQRKSNSGQPIFSSGSPNNPFNRGTLLPDDDGMEEGEDMNVIAGYYNGFPVYLKVQYLGFTPYETTALPEPSSIALLIGGLCLVKRRGRRAA